MGPIKEHIAPIGRLKEPIGELTALISQLTALKRLVWEGYCIRTNIPPLNSSPKLNPKFKAPRHVIG
jgi:hypothetical protein